MQARAIVKKLAAFAAGSRHADTQPPAGHQRTSDGARHAQPAPRPLTADELASVVGGARAGTDSLPVSRW